jgi:hypothetical protein
MSTSTPKFAIGEVVIVQCVSFPKYNGEHTVREILQEGSIYFDRIYNKPLRTVPLDGFRHRASPFGYIMEDILRDTDGYEVIYDESVLRKKHQPGELSWEELLNEERNEAAV